VDRDTLVAGGGQPAPVNWQAVRGWASLLSGAGVLAMMAVVLLRHWTPSTVLLNALILTAIGLALLTPASRPALLGFVLAACAFLAELFLILLQAAAGGR
jgi:hypothetical protein